MRVELTVNGERATLDVEPRRTLADALRENLGLTGTHVGCEHGVCGACTVLVDDQPVRACLMFAVQAEGSTVTTVEGLAAPDGSLHPLQQAFCDHHGLQCGFCTPGMLMSALALLRREPNPGRDRIREELSGNICRCTGYTGIIDAVDAAAGQDEMT
jgi:carbon-monoxide dehydrogenase small subunit